MLATLIESVKIDRWQSFVTPVFRDLFTLSKSLPMLVLKTIGGRGTDWNEEKADSYHGPSSCHSQGYSIDNQRSVGLRRHSEDQRRAWETDDARCDASFEVPWKSNLILKAGLKPRADGLGDEECSDGRHVLFARPMSTLDSVRSMARTAPREERNRSDYGSHAWENNATYQPQHSDDEVYQHSLDHGQQLNDLGHGLHPDAVRDTKDYGVAQSRIPDR